MTDPSVAERIVESALLAIAGKGCPHEGSAADLGDLPRAEKCLDCIKLAISEMFTTALTEARREVWEEAIKEVEERVQFEEKYRLGDIEKLRSGWSGIESGPCCEKCAMTENRPPKDSLQMFCGCWNPFQLPEHCECHLPFRKVAGKSIHQKMVELLMEFRRRSRAHDAE